jgi:hypothetical protein
MGGEEGERVGALSREFRIEHVEGVPRPDLGFHEGQFWTGIEPLHGPADAGFARDLPRFEPLAEQIPCEPSRPALRSAPPGAVRTSAVSTASTGARLGRPSGAAPREVPLRL